MSAMRFNASRELYVHRVLVDSSNATHPPIEPQKMPAAPSPNTMNSTVVLRRITIFSFPPALIMFIVHGVGSQWAFPAVGLVPLACSVVLGLLLLHRDKVAALGSPFQMLSSSNMLFADSLLAVSLLVCLIPTWALLDRPSESGLIILGTYCSVFLMLSFGIHLYFAAGEALHIVTSRTRPFKSLAADYSPLVDSYTDDSEDVESGTIMA